LRHYRPVVVALLMLIAYGCSSTRPAQPPTTPQVLRGIASWYGEEFAGRTTANGEIFDPLLLTAAHRTLPFGTVADITNPKNGQTVRVRVNDRGPYIGNRIIDLSYAAARQIGLIEPGVGDVEINVVTLGRGDREPPAPFAVTIAEAPRTVAAAPVVLPPPPPPVVVAPAPPEQIEAKPVEVVVDRVEVQEQHGSTVTRKQVASDGRTLEQVPLEEPIVDATPMPNPGPRPERPAPRPAPQRRTGKYIVQVGAFSIEANAKALRDRLVSIGQPAWIDRESLYRVRLGPFATRDEAAEARSALEEKGISAIIVTE
jgi:rare lipoprotein A